jgi:hypothetical protein
MQSRPPTAEEQFYLEQEYRDPVEGIARIEETAKFLVGATATTSGLFLAAAKLTAGSPAASASAPPGMVGFAPFLFWAAGLLALLLVLLPQPYRTGEREPASWKRACIRARWKKYRWLVAGALLYVLGTATAIWSLAL